MNNLNKYLDLNGNYVPKINRYVNNAERLFKFGRFKSRPVVLSIEPTNRCNSNCIMCRHPEHRKRKTLEFGDMDWSTFLSTRPFWKFANEVILCGNGEPFLHPEYIKMAKKLKEANCYVYTFSNGLLIDDNISEELVRMQYDRICISLGGSTAETYEKIRGIDGFDTVVHNLRRLQEIKGCKS